MFPLNSCKVNDCHLIDSAQLLDLGDVDGLLHDISGNLRSTN